MDSAELRFRAALAEADRLYAISQEEPMPCLAPWRGGENRDPMPRPDLAVTGLSPAACCVIEDRLNASPAALAAELAAGDYLSPDNFCEPPIIFTFTACSGSTLFCRSVHQAGLTVSPPFEIMHPETLPFFALALGARTVSQYLHLMSLFCQQRRPGLRGRFAFKLDYPELAAIKSSGYWRYWAPLASYVRIRRINLEKQGASLYKASITAQSASLQDAQRECTFGLDKLLAVYDDLLRKEGLWDDFYAADRWPAATFFYEEFSGEPIQAMRELLDWLGQSATAVAGSINCDDAVTKMQTDPANEALEQLIRSLRGVTTAERVRRLYRLVLERPPEADGLKYWTQIAEAHGFEAILRPIFGSDERRDLTGKRVAQMAARRAASEAGGAPRDPYHGHRTVGDIIDLETGIGVLQGIDFRIAMTTSCRDCDAIPKVSNAGCVVAGNEAVQIMHNGLRVLADGYYGPWMTEIIARLRGHHEPQEELAFHNVLQMLRGEAVMLELGGFWSYYSMWFVQGDPSQRRAFVIEPDPNHLAVGRRNAELNGLQIQFIQAAAAGVSGEASAFATETAGQHTLKVLSVPDFIAENKLEALDILHCDAQGIEFEVLRSCEQLFRDQRIRFSFISTHDKMFSGDPLIHQKCLAFLRFVGARILAEHDVHESFSGDGLIVAYSGKEKLALPEIRLSFNRYSSSLSRNPLVDLAIAQHNPAELQSG